MTNLSPSQIIKKSSRTYSTSAMFFPQPLRQRVYHLYAFVRTADDYVDQTPQDRHGFLLFKQQTLEAIKNGHSTNPIIHNMIQLQKESHIDPQNIFDFLSAMESDLKFTEFPTYPDLTKYIHGSAEVVGIMMARLMHLPRAADIYAAKLGHAMQLINFIRDIAIDLKLGRIYLPIEDRKRFHVDKPQISDVNTHNLIRFEIDRYRRIQRQAAQGYKYIPKKYLIPIKTAADMYAWTAQKISQNPDSVFSSTNKPSKARIILQYLYNFLTI